MAGKEAALAAAGITIREMDETDVGPIIALINAADAVDGADEGTSEPEFRHWLDSSTGADPRVVAEVAGGAIVGYGDVHHKPGDEGAWGWVLVHSDWRRRGIGTVLAERVRDRARRLGILWIDFAADTRLRAGNEWLARLGYEPVRSYDRMRLLSATPVPAPTYPPGFAVRPFRKGADEDVVGRILHATFTDHHNTNLISAEQMPQNVNQPWFDPTGVLLAETAEGRLAGLCWCYINRDENRRRGETVGWINDLEIAAAYRRQGLGRSLLYDGIAWNRAQGVECVELWVESTNREARTLYLATGFKVNKSVVDYRHFLRRFAWL